MGSLRIVIDTNVMVSALRSQSGASYKLLMSLGTGRFDISVSVPLAVEYEAALKRLPGNGTGITAKDIDDILDYIVSIASRTKVHYLWRPVLADPADDMVLETASASGSSVIATYNAKDFAGAGRFGVRALTPLMILKETGDIP